MKSYLFHKPVAFSEHNFQARQNDLCVYNRDTKHLVIYREDNIITQFSMSKMAMDTMEERGWLVPVILKVADDEGDLNSSVGGLDPDETEEPGDPEDEDVIGDPDEDPAEVDQKEVSEPSAAATKEPKSRSLPKKHGKKPGRKPGPKKV